MRVLALINHGLLILLGVSTGMVKVAGLFTQKGVEFEFALFYKAGFNYTAVVLFGVVQVAGALMLLHPKTLKPGAIVLLVTFVVATGVLFLNGQLPFGAFSMSFWAMAGLCFAKNKFSEASA